MLLSGEGSVVLKVPVVSRKFFLLYPATRGSLENFWNKKQFLVEKRRQHKPATFLLEGRLILSGLVSIYIQHIYSYADWSL